jgi:hypothetical protein
MAKTLEPADISRGGASQVEPDDGARPTSSGKKAGGQNRSRRAFLPYVTLACAVLACIGLSIAVTTGFDSGSKLRQLLLRLVLVTPAIVWVLRQRDREENQAIRRIPLVPFFLVFITVVVPLSWYVRNGVYSADESAYRFQARVVRSLHAYAQAPPAAVLKQFAFQNEVRYEGRWFGKYPPGWPALLAALGWLMPEWLVSPALGLVLIWLVYKIACRLYDERVAAISVGLMACSPFVLFLSVGYLSHIACAVFVAIATLSLLLALESGRTRDFALSCGALGAAFLIRPFTAVCLGVVWGALVTGSVRNRRITLQTVLMIGGPIGVIAASVLLYDNALLTGSFWKSPYAVAARSDLPPELVFSFSNLLRNAVTFTRAGIARTELHSVPFALALAAYAVVKERSKRSWLLAMAPLSLMLGHMFFSDVSSDSFAGERYYFEAYFAVTILAAVGWVRLCKEWKPSRWAIRAVIAAAGCLTLYNYVYLTRGAIKYRRGYAAVYERAEQLKGDRLLVFMEGGGKFFVAPNFNPNSADWQDSRVLFALDPGDQQSRKLSADALHRPTCFVIAYDAHSRKPIVTEPSQ